MTAEKIRFANQHQQARRSANAETTYLEILQNDPRRVDANFALGRLYQ